MIFKTQYIFFYIGPPQMQPMSYQTRSQPYGFRSQQQPPPQMMGYGARPQPPFGYYYEG